MVSGRERERKREFHRISDCFRKSSISGEWNQMKKQIDFYKRIAAKWGEKSLNQSHTDKRVENPTTAADEEDALYSKNHRQDILQEHRIGCRLLLDGTPTAAAEERDQWKCLGLPGEIPLKPTVIYYVVSNCYVVPLPEYFLKCWGFQIQEKGNFRQNPNINIFCSTSMETLECNNNNNIILSQLKAWQLANGFDSTELRS